MATISALPNKIPTLDDVVLILDSSTGLHSKTTIRDLLGSLGASIRGGGTIVTQDGHTATFQDRSGTIPVQSSSSTLDASITGGGFIVTHAGRTVTFENETGTVPVFQYTEPAGEYYPVAVGAWRTISHTLGRVPTIFQLVAVCTSTEDGWIEGDELHLDRFNFKSVVGDKFDRFAVTNLTSTTIQVYVPDGNLDGPRKTTGDDVTLSKENWSFQVRIW